jgi:hypothetical protein
MQDVSLSFKPVANLQNDFDQKAISNFIFGVVIYRVFQEQY